LFTVFDQARNFKIAAERCFEVRPLNEKQFECLMIPAIVNASFACELFLKAIIDARGTIRKKEHSLKELFGLLPYQDNESIKENLEDADFLAELDAISDSFVKWRYLHEKTDEESSLNIDFLLRFMNTLYKISCCFYD